MWNDNETNIDLFGHARIAKTISALIREERMSPLTMGVHGDWGAGKSSVLQLVEQELKDDDDVLCLRFNGWLFQGFDDTKVTTMEAIVGALRDRRPQSKKVKEKVGEMFARIDWFKFVRRTAGIVVTGLTGVPDPTFLSELMQKLSGIVSTPTESVTVDQLKAAAEVVQASIKDANARTVPDEIVAFRSEFEELIETAGLKRLVVLVDDLDRCLPETTIDVLEAMRLFLYVPGSVFVFAADPQMIAYAVKQHFPDLPVGVGPNDYAQNYLEKLIQVPFHLPPLGKSETRTYITLLLAERDLPEGDETLGKLRTLMTTLLSRPWEGRSLDTEHLKKIGIPLTEQLSNSLLLADRISKPLAEGLRGNPRQIKRFLNTLVVRLQIAEAHGIGNVSVETLAKLMLAERFKVEFYKDIGSRSSETQDGTVEALTTLESQPTMKGKSKSSHSGIEKSQREWSEDAWITAWARIDPPLGTVDLRPYYFVSRERGPGFTTELGVGADLEHLAGQLSSGNDILIQGTQGKLKELDNHLRRKLFQHLAERCRVQNWKTKPSEIKGVDALCRLDTDLQLEFVQLLENRPVDDLGAWVTTGMKDVITGDTSRERYGELVNKWKNQDSNKPLQKAAESWSKI